MESNQDNIQKEIVKAIGDAADRNGLPVITNQKKAFDLLDWLLSDEAGNMSEDERERKMTEFFS